MPPGVIPLNAKRPALIQVMQRFPEEFEVLQHLFQVNDSFRSLCEDYRDCQAALRHWQLSTLEEAPAMRGVYEELLQELEQEVCRYLEGEKSSRTRQP